MKTLIALALLASPTAFALSTEGWKVDGIQVNASTLTRADGGRVELPRSEEVVLSLNLETTQIHGSPEHRYVKKQSVSGSRISIEIESAAEKNCSREGGVSLSVMAPHFSRVNTVLKQGRYELEINGDILGTVNVGDSDAQLSLNSGYAAAVNARHRQEFMDTFGDLSNLSVAGRDCNARLEFRDGKVLARYHFDASQQTLPNGDVLSKKEINETLELRVRTSWDCPRSVGGPISWKAEFSGSKQDQALTVRQGQNSYTFRLRDRYCSQ